MATGVTTKLEEVWGERVASRREFLGLSQRQLAEKLSIPCTQQTISKIELGDIAPRDSLKIAIAKALRAAPSRLFPLDGGA